MPARPASSVIRALDVLSDPWSFLVLREAFFGVNRFDALQSNLMIARNILSDRMSRLVKAGALQRCLYEKHPPRSEYRLTEAGRDFYPAIIALMAWGDRWRPRKFGPPLELLHSCGHTLVPRVVCAACRQPLLAEDVAFKDGPGAGRETEFEIPLTRRRGTDQAWLRGRPCSVARTLKAVGDRWSLRILREAFVGVKRFEDFQRNLDIARNILSDRLARLVHEAVLTRRRYQDSPARSEYVLAPAGRDLYQSLILFMAWGDKWRRPQQGVPLILRHRLCGKRANPILICSHCGGKVIANQMTYRMHYVYPKKPRTSA
jgi:DNA-binding HxlR family transcriptional regulator